MTLNTMTPTLMAKETLRITCFTATLSVFKLSVILPSDCEPKKFYDSEVFAFCDCTKMF